MSPRHGLRCGAAWTTPGQRASRVDASRILPELLLIVLLLFGISAALHTGVVGDVLNGVESVHATEPLVSVSLLSTNPNDG